MTYRPPDVACGHCGRVGRKSARGLIAPCYRSLYRTGELADWPRSHRSADDVLDEWYELARNPPEGIGKADIATRMGLAVKTLDKALDRARKRGDPRAIYAIDWRTGRRFEPGREPINPVKARDRIRQTRYRQLDVPTQRRV